MSTKDSDSHEAKGASELKPCHKTRNELIRVYKQTNPSQLSKVDQLLKKYKGKEDALFRSVYSKYRPSRRFTLKRYPVNDKNPDKNLMQKYSFEIQFESIMPYLERHAKNLDGSLGWDLIRGGVERVLNLVVPRGYSASENTLDATVGEMRDLVHRRCQNSVRWIKQGKSYLPENERRQLEKEKNTMKSHLPENERRRLEKEKNKKKQKGQTKKSGRLSGVQGEKMVLSSCRPKKLC